LRNRAGVAIAIALTSWSATACGSGASSSTTSVQTRSTPAAQRSSTRHRTSHPRVGEAQRVKASGATLSVTVLRVLDPLVGSGAALASGTRAVGVVVRIANHGPGVYDSSATGDISVVPSTGTATPAFASQGICQTPLRDFDNYITAGEIRRGCVAFAVSGGAKLIAVRFSPHGQTAGRATWLAGR